VVFFCFSGTLKPTAAVFPMFLIAYPGGGFTAIEPIREINHDRAFELLECLAGEYHTHQDIDRLISECWQVVEALCLCVPTIDGLTWDMGKLKQSPALIKSLFLDEESTIVRIHRFEPKVRPKEDGDRLEDLEFPSGGCDRADQLASFFNSTEWPPSEVERLLRLCSREELHSLAYSMSELSNPDRRIAEKAKAIFEEEYDMDDVEQMLNAVRAGGDPENAPS
jgi:hypothetical protein